METTAAPTPVSTGSSARFTLVSGLLLGLLADRLWTDYGTSPLTLLIVFGAFCGSALWLARRSGSPVLLAQALWSALALFCVMMMMLRHTEILNLLLLLSLPTTIALFLLQRSGLGLRTSEPHHALTAGLLLFTSMAGRSVSLLQSLSLQDKVDHAGIRRAVLGSVIALPVLLLFWQLFMAADAAFERWALQLQWLSPTLPWHVFSVLVLGWIASGVMALAWQPVAADRDRFRVTLGTTEATIVLAAVSALFVLFAGFQLANLFSSPADNVARAGLSIAEFARHGFFQLMWIAPLALALLALLSSCAAQLWYRRLGVLLLACVVIVMASSVQRIAYYLDNYGLTVDRIVACAVLLWLALCIAAFAVTVLHRRAGGFLALAASMAVAICLLLTLLNPAALAVHANVALARTQQKPLDLDYLLALGSDAVPALIDELPALPSREQCTVATAVINSWWDPLRYATPAQRDWRNWNASPMLAATAVHNHIDVLQQAARRSGNSYYDDTANFEQPFTTESSFALGCQ